MPVHELHCQTLKEGIAYTQFIRLEHITRLSPTQENDKFFAVVMEFVHGNFETIRLERNELGRFMTAWSGDSRLFYKAGMRVQFNADYRHAQSLIVIPKGAKATILQLEKAGEGVGLELDESLSNTHHTVTMLHSYPAFVDLI